MNRKAAVGLAVGFALLLVGGFLLFSRDRVPERTSATAAALLADSGDEAVALSVAEEAADPDAEAGDSTSEIVATAESAPEEAGEAERARAGSGGELRVLVLEPDGITPAVEAEVYTMEDATSSTPYRIGPGPPSLSDRGIYKTDEEGIAELSVRKGLETFGVLVHHSSGYAAVDFGQFVDREEDPIEVVLAQSGRLAGRVLDPEGNPVEGVRHQFNRRYSWFRNHQNLARLGIGTTESDGKFEYPLLGSGSYTLSVRAPDDSGLIFEEGNVQLDLAADERREGYDITLSWADSLRGTVTDTDGDPIEGARVYVRPHEAFTDAEGRYEVEGLSRLQPIEVVVTAEGHERQRRPNVLAYRGEQNFRLARRDSAIIIGLDRDGSPLERYRLFVRLDYGDAMSSRIAEVVVEEPDGRYEMERLIIGQSYQAEAIVPGDRGSGAENRHGGALFTFTEPGQEITVTLDGDPLRLRVVEGTEGGDPVEGVAVTANMEAILGAGSPGQWDFNRSDQGETDTSGTIEFADFPPGLYRIRLDEPWHLLVDDGNRHAIVRHVQGSDEPHELRAVRGFPVGGIVVDEEGNPAADYPVFARALNPPVTNPHTTRTGSDGRFLFEGLPPNAHSILPQSSFEARYKPIIVTPSPDFEEDLRFEPMDTILLRGRMELAGALGRENLSLSDTETIGRSGARVRPSETGTYEMEVIHGTYRLRHDLSRSDGRNEMARHEEETVDTIANPMNVLHSYTHGHSLHFFTEPFEVEPEPAVQERDFDLRFGWMDIETPDGDLGERFDTLTILQHDSPGGPPIYGQTLHVERNPSIRIGPVFEGFYTVLDEESGWTTGAVEVRTEDQGTIFLLFPPGEASETP